MFKQVKHVKHVKHVSMFSMFKDVSMFSMFSKLTVDVLMTIKQMKLRKSLRDIYRMFKGCLADV